MPVYVINGLPVSKDEFWTQNSTVLVSFGTSEGVKKEAELLIDSTFPTNEEKIKRFVEIKLPAPEGHSTRHKAAANETGLKGLITELNKSRMASDIEPLDSKFNTIKEFYLGYFKNDEWALNKIAGTKDETELEIAIEQITGRSAEEQTVFNHFDIKKEDFKNGVEFKFSSGYFPSYIKETDFKGSQVLIGENKQSKYNMKEPLQRLGQVKKDYYGVKHNSDKLPMSLLFKQFPRALQAIILTSCYGHSKYKDSDSDFKNFSRVAGGSKTYSDADIRHQLDKEIYGDKDESGLPHVFHEAFDKLAKCELYIQENGIDIKQMAAEYLKNLK